MKTKTLPMKDDPAHNWKAANGGKRELNKHAGHQSPQGTMTDDFGHEVTEARVLPIGGDGNIICGRVGYAREIANRRESTQWQRGTMGFANVGKSAHLFPRAILTHSSVYRIFTLSLSFLLAFTSVNPQSSP